MPGHIRWASGSSPLPVTSNWLVHLTDYLAATYDEEVLAVFFFCGVRPLVFRVRTPTYGVHTRCFVRSCREHLVFHLVSLKRYCGRGSTGDERDACMFVVVFPGAPDGNRCCNPTNLAKKPESATGKADGRLEATNGTGEAFALRSLGGADGDERRLLFSWLARDRCA